MESEQNALKGALNSLARAAFRLDPGDAEKTVLAVLSQLSPGTLATLLSENTKETIIEVGAAEAGDKKTHAFVDGVKQIIIRSEKVTQINYSFNDSNYDAGKTLTITSGGQLKLSAANFTGKTIYFNADKNNVNVEILELY